MSSDETLQPYGPEMTAVRRVIHGIAGTDLTDETGLLEAAVEAADRVENLEERVAELEKVVDPDPGTTEYEQLTKSQKVHRIRKTLVENAARTNGRDGMKYKAVMTLFNGHPSPGHCYDLMERAGYADGFAYDESAGGEKRIQVDVADVNDETLVHAANKATKGMAV